MALFRDMLALDGLLCILQQRPFSYTVVSGGSLLMHIIWTKMTSTWLCATKQLLACWDNFSHIQSSFTYLSQARIATKWNHSDKKLTLMSLFNPKPQTFPILFCFILFCKVLYSSVYSILFLLYSVLFYFILSYSIVFLNFYCS